MILTEILLLLRLLQINGGLKILKEYEHALVFGVAPILNLQAKQVE